MPTLPCGAHVVKDDGHTQPRQHTLRLLQCPLTLILTVIALCYVLLNFPHSLAQSLTVTPGDAAISRPNFELSDVTRLQQLFASKTSGFNVFENILARDLDNDGDVDIFAAPVSAYENSVQLLLMGFENRGAVSSGVRFFPHVLLHDEYDGQLEYQLVDLVDMVRC
jgi:hypothetical protein